MSHTPEDLERRLFKALHSDRTLMLGLDGAEDGHTRPMTAFVEDGRGPLWFFTSRPNPLVGGIGPGARAVAAFASKGHDLFASIRGSIRVENDRAVVERLWNPFIAAWFEGKDDPRLVLLRLDPDQAEVWLNENNLLAGVKMLLGVDPREDYRDKVATVDLR